MSPPVSVAFSVPCNRVQTTFANRVGTNPQLSADAMLGLWRDGYQIDVAALAGHTPSAPHEEVPLVFCKRPTF